MIAILRRASIALGCMAAVAAGPAQAAITSISFTGSGAVTALAGAVPAGIAIGDPVTGGGTITINPGAPQIADDFTGQYILSGEFLEDGLQEFSFAVGGPTIGFGVDSGPTFIYSSGYLTFVDGRLTDFLLDDDDDGYWATISSTGFRLEVLYGDPRLGGYEIRGSFNVDPSPGVPEPATWALMIVGFGLVGSIKRRHHAAASRS